MVFVYVFVCSCGVAVPSLLLGHGGDVPFFMEAAVAVAIFVSFYVAFV